MKDGFQIITDNIVHNSDVIVTLMQSNNIWVS